MRYLAFAGAAPPRRGAYYRRYRRGVGPQLPDDGTGALPLLRGIILNDDKSSTYKLALLRAILRVADGTFVGGRVRDIDAVDLPLGLVALNSVRMFLPLVSARLPQSPGNAGAEGLGFAREAFRALGPLGIAAQELRYGAQFTGEHGRQSQEH
jgi:hypothetical protein